MSRCPHCKSPKLFDYKINKFTCGTQYDHYELSREPNLIEVGDHCNLRWTFDKKMY